MRGTSVVLLVTLVIAAGAAAGQQQPVAPPATAGHPARMAATPGGVPAMQPPVLAPRFIEVGRFYRFILVRKELRGEVLEVDPSGWIRVHFRDDDEDIPRVPWLNLTHVTMVVPESSIDPVDD